MSPFKPKFLIISLFILCLKKVILTSKIKRGPNVTVESYLNISEAFLHTQTTVVRSNSITSTPVSYCGIWSLPDVILQYEQQCKIASPYLLAAPLLMQSRVWNCFSWVYWCLGDSLVAPKLPELLLQSSSPAGQHQPLLLLRRYSTSYPFSWGSCQIICLCRSPNFYYTDHLMNILDLLQAWWDWNLHHYSGY